MAEGATLRAAIGNEVRARLVARPGLLRIPCAELELYVLRDFLTAKECAALARLIDAERMPSQLLAPAPDPEFRTSESCNLNPRLPIVAQIEAKIADLTGHRSRAGRGDPGAALCGRPAVQGAP